MVEHRLLSEFEAQYIKLPLDNYLWFSGHFMQLARDLYTYFGRSALTRMWQMFVLGKIADVPDVALRQQMSDADPAIAGLLITLPEQYAA
jgi:hypothetical protein